MPRKYTRDCPKCGEPFTPQRQRQRYCSKRCASAARAYPPVEDRFWAKVDKSAGPDGCWPWLASRSNYGHGRFTARPGFKTSASRFVWELLHGPVQDDLFVLHHCPQGDNAACVNPAHLHLGTHADNMREMRERGRGANGAKNGAYTHPDRVNRGERHYKARLTAEDVRIIRKRYAAGESQRRLANEYGVSTDHVGNIVRRKSWRHIG